MTAYPFDGDLDAILEHVAPSAKARTLVDHYDSIARAFVAEFEAGLISRSAVRALYGLI